METITGLIYPLILAFMTAVFGFVVWLMQQRYKRNNDDYRKRREDAEKRRDDYITLLVQMTGAAIALGEANSVALQNGKCNGETHKALEYAQRVKHDNRDFLLRAGVENIF